MIFAPFGWIAAIGGGVLAIYYLVPRKHRARLIDAMKPDRNTDAGGNAS